MAAEPRADFRRNPLTGEWVVVAPQRAARPATFRTGYSAPATFPTEQPAPASPVPASARCPFCPGHERETPPEVARTGEGDPDTPGWRVRVVPNLYPIVPSGHEVAVLSPDHGRSLAHLSEGEALEVFEVLRQRVKHHLAAGRRYVQVLVNHGRDAGASIEHPHAQLVAVDHEPPAVLREAAFLDRDPSACELCRLVAGDALGPLAVARNADALAWCPWASGVPYEVLVAPVAHTSGPPADVLPSLAPLLRDAASRLEAALGDVPYNLVVHLPPRPGATRFHEHAHLWPRLTVPAGFEQGTGILVNVVDPEVAARALREAGESGRPR